MGDGTAMNIEDRIRALVVRFAKAGAKLPRIVMKPDGVILTENGNSKLISWDDWEECRWK